MTTHFSQLPEKPLIAGMSETKKEINRTFFFQRSDGEVIATEEREAWNLYTRRPQVLGTARKPEFKLIGTGDGEIFRAALAEAQMAGKTDIKQAQAIIKKGIQDELEACRGHIIPPRDMDKIA